MIGQTLQIKNNLLVVEKKPRKRLPNSILTFFLTFQFVYGFSFGFIDVLNKKIRHFCKIISLLVCLYTSIIFFLGTPIFVREWNLTVYWSCLHFVQYCGHIILLYLSKYKVHNFITDIRGIDDAIQSREHKLGLYACITYGFEFVSTMILSVIFCIGKNDTCILQTLSVNITYIISAIGLDTIVIVQLIVNFYVYYGVIYLVGLVEKEKVGFIRKQFLRILECCDKFGGYYGNVVVLVLFINIPKYLTILCNAIYNFKEDVDWKIYVVRLSYTINIIFQMCGPAVIVEVVNKQMDKLRFKLYKRLLEEKDLEKHLELSSLLRYMEQKPLYSNAWRVIPTDMNLVVAVFSLVTTYVVVIIQFMHIY